MNSILNGTALPREKHTLEWLVWALKCRFWHFVELNKALKNGRWPDADTRRRASCKLTYSQIGSVRLDFRLQNCTNASAVCYFEGLAA
jgi:hypothetical protein